MAYRLENVIFKYIKVEADRLKVKKKGEDG